MTCYIHCVHKLAVMITLMLAVTGCSVFISTPRVARIQVQQLDNKLVEYVIDLENPTHSNLGIRLTNDYSLQLDFEWLWRMDDQSNIYTDIYLETDADFEEPRLTPWMLCRYRF